MSVRDLGVERSSAWTWRTSRAPGKVSAAMATEAVVRADMMARVAERAVAYRCPKLATSKSNSARRTEDSSTPIASVSLGTTAGADPHKPWAVRHARNYRYRVTRSCTVSEPNRSGTSAPDRRVADLTVASAGFGCVRTARFVVEAHPACRRNRPSSRRATHHHIYFSTLGHKIGDADFSGNAGA